jgi:hypothetical protein
MNLRALVDFLLKGQRLLLHGRHYEKIDDYRLLTWKSPTPRVLVKTQEIPDILPKGEKKNV